MIETLPSYYELYVLLVLACVVLGLRVVLCLVCKTVAKPCCLR